MSQRRAKGSARSRQARLDFKILEGPTVEIPIEPGFFTTGTPVQSSTEAREALAAMAETQNSENPFVHVDDFIDDFRTDQYASFVLALFRFPAVLANKCADFIDRYQLFCRYKGRGYRVTGCSRMGDVWLSADFNRKTGYELRVNVADCSDWCPNKP